ncbi:hypothetical protein KBAHV22_29550 [Aeromonas hydrophila]|nr:hypothetical protein KBAHV42_29500 [Aeromonas hydrophila]CAD7545220.1 hypothetical protein KBAHV01_29410 [Aeromonas hydrophila]CAD7545587.1 hypothetical protein KBAHV22_29550 [Aeromonas hydrophila]
MHDVEPNGVATGTTSAFEVLHFLVTGGVDEFDFAVALLWLARLFHSSSEIEPGRLQWAGDGL